MRFVPLLVTIATLASPKTASARRECMVCTVETVLDGLDRFLRGAPHGAMTRQCDGTFIPCMATLRESLRQIGMYLDGSCDDCGIFGILKRLKSTLQIHFPDSDPYGIDDIGCRSIHCLINDIREILLNLLGERGYKIIGDTGCHSQRCQLRSIFMLLKGLGLRFSEFREPRSLDCGDDWNCLLRTINRMASRRNSYDGGGDYRFSVKPLAHKTPTSIPGSCRACIKQKGCETCKKLYNCNCQ